MASVVSLEDRRPIRRKLPDERDAVTHKFSIAGHEGYLTVGLYEERVPGEIFLRMAKEGSTISGLMDTIATMTSIALQYGVPLKTLVDKFSHTRFEPAGFTNNKEIPMAKSVTDYVFRYLGNRFLRDEARVEDEQETEAEATGLAVVAGGSGSHAAIPAAAAGPSRTRLIRRPVPAAVSSLIRSGACYKCPQLRRNDRL